MSEYDPFAVDLGGESSCYAHLLCRDCGVVLPAIVHRPSCQMRSPTEKKLNGPHNNGT